MFMDRWTIGQQLYAGCAALLLVTASAGTVALTGAARIKGDAEQWAAVIEITGAKVD